MLSLNLNELGSAKLVWGVASELFQAYRSHDIVILERASNEIPSCSRNVRILLPKYHLGQNVSVI
jgi:hypothetical protein